MPPRNNPLPNAINLFHCDRCGIGFPRQPEYENHLHSYGHTHNKRLDEMKQITANKAESSSRPKGPLDMRAINNGNTKKPVLGSGFTKIGGVGAGFKKVGKVTSGSADRQDSKKPEGYAMKLKETVEETVEEAGKDLNINAPAIFTAETVSGEVEVEARQEVEPAAVRSDREGHTEDKEKPKNDHDVAMSGCEVDNANVITWQEYDFTRPTDCEHAKCPGCCAAATEYDEEGWVVLPSHKEEAMET